MFISMIPHHKAEGVCIDYCDVSLTQLISNPVMVDAKGDAPLFNLAQYRTGIRDLNDVISYNGVILDFDSGVKFSTIAKQLIGFKYYMYTSFSNSPEIEKFRIIIPSEKPISAESYHNPAFKMAISTFFDGIDISSADPSRFFYLPCYTTHFSNAKAGGELWWPSKHKAFFEHYKQCCSIIAETQAKFNQPSKPNRVWLGDVRIDNTQSDSTERFKEAVAQRTCDRLDTMDWTRSTGVHPALKASAANLIKCGFTVSEAWEIMGPYECFAHKNEIRKILDWFIGK